MAARPVLIVILVAACWSFLEAFVPASTYWRDSGEFILSAFFLDVAHPAGFPLFSQLGNLFALLPFGPIAWRINSFSCFLGLLNLCLLYAVTILLIRPATNLSLATKYLLALISPCILAFSIAFLRQSFTAEVYNLNALIILTLVLIYLRYQESSDRRLLILCGFLGGLGLGNHAALGLVLLPAVLIICSEFRAAKKVAIPALLAGMMGVSVYAYIPVRAAQSLPLNTGEPSSFKRLINHMSDARDRTLRAADPAAIDSSIVHMQGVSGSAVMKTLSNDVKTMQTEAAPVLLILGLLGLLLLIAHRVRVGLLITSSATATWLFFLGWDADPWLPVFCAVGIGCAYIAAIILSKFSSSAFLQTSSAVLLVLAVLSVSSPVRAMQSLKSIRSFELPAEAAKIVMGRIPHGSVYLTEASWFLLSYIQKIEGVRDDVELVYQPSVLFPEYFARVILRDVAGKSYDSWNVNHAADSPMLPQEQNLSAFTDVVTKIQTLGFEPNMLLNRFYAPLIQCNDVGYAYLRHGALANCSPAYSAWYVQFLKALAQESLKSWPGFQADTAHFYEGQLSNAADLLRKAESASAARKLIANACLGPTPALCKLTSLNNLATYYMDEGNYREAARLLLSMQNGEYRDAAAVRKNLALATKNLDAATAEQIFGHKP